VVGNRREAGGGGAVRRITPERRRCTEFYAVRRGEKAAGEAGSVWAGRQQRVRVAAAGI